MTEYSDKDTTIFNHCQLLDKALSYEMQQNAILIEALEHIASDTEENRQLIAQEVLEAIAVTNNNNKEK